MEGLNLANGADNTEEFTLAEVASPHEVLARIHAIVKDFLQNLAGPRPTISPLSMISRTPKNVRLSGDTSDKLESYQNSSNFSDRHLAGLRGQKVTSFMRVWKVLEIIGRLLQEGKQATQRDVYYQLLSDVPHLVQKQSHVNEAIQDVVALLRCTRCSLGIYTSSRGAVIGRLKMKEDGAEAWVDCTKLGLIGMAISGNIPLLNSMRFESSANYILVIEKDAIFQRLAEDRFFDLVPSILITARGFPDLATRVLLHQLHVTFPALPILGLVDWNPAGLAIINTYRFGSPRMALESPHYVCDIKWLGVRSADLEHIPQQGFQPLTPRDLVLLRNLLTSNTLQRYPRYREELLQMENLGTRAEIEALYANGYDFLKDFIAHKIRCCDYI